ncbi:Hachiman antiphage defense system protein HamA [Methylobacter sp.]|uniref:Hachiman antiphage defense system protein HamA n=1 Tax=Methylobacter sp. TaxID=2051955 RepID=UPI0011FF5D89|nr:Hachiman antiphage defense system protein HamA [Methylobacter sp.]TAK63393.1 MAG: DUF1837 domain-containing protein [Methylobacter sp.]
MEVSKIFYPHKMPTGSLPVRCHVLLDTQAKLLEEYLVQQLPWCYTTKKHIQQRVNKTELSACQIIANKLPDPGSVMSGDFGEVLTLFFLSSERTENTTPIKKWRYKENRLKAAPLSDVILLYREFDDKLSKNDFVICAEAKQKATKSKEFFPIEKSIEGFELDKTGRLARTLTWLKEKAIDQESSKKINFINRFTSNHLSVEYKKHFKAVAIVDRELLDEELIRQLKLPQQDESFEVIVLGIDKLKSLYETVYSRAQAEVTIE